MKIIFSSSMTDNKATRHEEIMAQIRTDPNSVASMLVEWETELSKVMPLDYKDWWQNSKREWPIIARMSIESLREREKLAGEAVTTVQDKLDWEMGT